MASAGLKTPRDEVRHNAASTPPVKAVLAAGYCRDVLNSMGHDTYPATRTAATVCGSSSGRCGITANLIPSP
jgi:hypothetical protein